MIVGKTNIVELFQQNGKPYFAIFYKGKTENAIRRNDKDEAEYDYPQGKQQLEEFLHVLGSGEYTLVTNDKKDCTSKGGLRFDFKIPVGDGIPQQQQAPQAAVGYVSSDEVDRKAEILGRKIFNELMLENETKQLREKCKELERDLKEAQVSANSGFNKLIGACGPHLPEMVGQVFGKPATIATTMVSGVPADAEGINDVDAQLVMENFIEALQAAKPDTWKQILQQVTILIKEQPSKFDTVLTFL